MAEKKEETKAVQEVTYTVDEFAENRQIKQNILHYQIH